MQVNQRTERSRRNGERMKEAVYSCTLEYQGDLHPSFISPIVYGMNTEIPVDTYIPFDPYYMFPEQMIERNHLFDNTGVEVSIPGDCSDIGLSAGPITRHTEDLNELLSFPHSGFRHHPGQNIELYRESLDHSLHPFDRLEIEMYRSLDSQSNISIIRIILYGTDLRENAAINTISDIISNVLCTRLEYMKEVERRVSEKPLWKDISKYRDYPVILAIYREYMFIFRGDYVEFFGYFYDQGDTDLILIHGVNSDDNYIVLIPDIYDPDSHINQIINVLLRNAHSMHIPWSPRTRTNEENFWMSLLSAHSGYPGLL